MLRANEAPLCVRGINEPQALATSSATIGAVALATVFALSLATDAALGASPISTFCPSASVVNTVLGQKNKAPVSTVEPFGKTCTYHGSGAVSTTIAFQKDTAASFADGEKAAAILGIVKVPGLGQAAWATKAGGSLTSSTRANRSRSSPHSRARTIGGAGP